VEIQKFGTRGGAHVVGAGAGIALAGQFAHDASTSQIVALRGTPCSVQLRRPGQPDRAALSSGQRARERRTTNAAILTSVPPPLPSGTQEYLLQARQMQALSFAVHIPLVCFGIAFLAIILFVEWLYLRTGDKLYRTLAQR
jgi:hypothetical protein